MKFEPTTVRTLIGCLTTERLRTRVVSSGQYGLGHTTTASSKSHCVNEHAHLTVSRSHAEYSHSTALIRVKLKLMNKRKQLNAIQLKQRRQRAKMEGGGEGLGTSENRGWRERYQWW